MTLHIKNFQELVSQIKAQIPIHELISEYVSIKKSGRGYVALCPFHDDHHPSMHINPDKGIFKCFSCGTGGDLIYFYSQINKKKWSEAMTDIATKYGFKIEYSDENKPETQIKDKLYELNKVALDFFRKNLFSKSGDEALNYLINIRGFSKEIINKYEIGFALNSWDALLLYLSREKQYPQELIIASGLFVPRENSNGYYDRFRNRVIVPILSENNHVIGFGGRTVTNEEPKYLNSPETLVFNKGSILYGLNFAKDEIKKSGYVILTEGYFDVISAHQYGLLNTVATLGTALTPYQARLLGKYTESKKVCLCMDSDNAGKKAVESIFRLINSADNNILLDVGVVPDLGAKDLDEALKLNNLPELKNKIERVQRLIYFVLDGGIKRYISAQSDFEKKSILDELLQTIIDLRDPLEQNDCIKYISHSLKIEEGLLNLKVKDKSKTAKKRFTRSQKPDPGLKNNNEEQYTMHSIERFKHAEVELLTLYVSSFPYSSKEIQTELNKIQFIDEKHQLVKDFLDNISQEEITPDKVINALVQEFNEYRHIMATVSDLAWRIESDLVLSYSKNKAKILSEAKEWINWWINNKQKLKSLTEMLKDCKNITEESNILLEMMKIVKDSKKVNG
ncbi:MAG: DNA primase [Candidatus Melainabacteria bacterium RIFCSPLOWO2_02_FULL_35_15]|nr:MAG: DNA primase [Candidatus Melainabacteria bacterium RIFCSPLOWO2_12_FULL_35_11]OGI14050.1 MAG: DNA primase [Candidatus Melainabacteria bacterium RIFCSPLOWO2_02_FULL_35_15]